MDVITLFLITTAQFNLPPNLLNSLCYVESRHNIQAIHHDDGKGDSLGICQIKYETARLMGFQGTANQLMDPKTNIYFAGKYLNHQLTRYNHNITKAIIAYNIGSAKQLIHSKYSDKVIKQWGITNDRSKSSKK